MKLKSLKYSRKEGEKAEWILEGKPEKGQYGQYCTFDDINLIVGQNATGKTNTLKVIRELADLLCGDIELAELSYHSARYDIEFSNNRQKIVYALKFNQAKVSEEQLFINGESVLERDLGGVGKLVVDKTASNRFKFKPTENKLLVLIIREALQLPLFEALYQWGKSLTHYQFGSQMGKDTMARLRDQNEDFSLKSSSNAISAFEKAKNRFGKEFIEMIQADMAKMRYSIEEIGTAPLKRMKTHLDSAVALFVKETDLNDTTDQSEMSQGLFRVLSLIVQLNYSLLAKVPSCILIDDIGEGLDYGRSKSLIDLIIKKAKDSKVQIFMTTNDRFVMNNTALEYWSILNRSGQKSLCINYRNSKKVFDEFELTGLSNFNFFSSNYFLKQD
jgi:AAA15 family ATPase/GTPase